MKKLTLTLLTLFISCQSDNKNEFENKVISEIKKTDIPAVVMGKIHKSGQMDFYSFGPSRWERNDTISEKDLFWIASMTKVITSVAGMQLVDKGIISLDEPLDKYLPEMTEIPILNDNFELVEAKQKITLRHLLTHSSGFGNKNSHPKILEWEKIKGNYEWKYLYPFPRMFESGTSYLYGISTSWLGILIERLTKISLADYMKENLFMPMEMNNTFFEYDMTDKQTEMLVSSSQRNLKTRKLEKKEPKNDLFNDWDYFKKIVPDYKYSGQGSINSTPEDFGKFMQIFLNKGTYKNHVILSEKSFEEFISPQLNGYKIEFWADEVEGGFDFSGRGDLNHFFDEYDNHSLGMAYEEQSKSRPIGSGYWAGAWNSYFMVDFQNEFGIVYMTQIRDFNDVYSYNLFTSFERLIYDEIKNNKESNW